MAHERLDAAVADAYGWPHDLADEQVLERLLMLNRQRAEDGLIPAMPGRRGGDGG